MSCRKMWSVKQIQQQIRQTAVVSTLHWCLLIACNAALRYTYLYLISKTTSLFTIAVMKLCWKHLHCPSHMHVPTWKPAASPSLGSNRRTKLLSVRDIFTKYGNETRHHHHHNCHHEAMRTATRPGGVFSETGCDNSMLSNVSQSHLVPGGLSLQKKYVYHVV